MAERHVPLQVHATAVRSTGEAEASALSREASSVPADPRARAAVAARPSVRGKFLWVGDEKLTLRGATYGTFRPDADGEEYHLAAVVRDFRRMADAGITAVRVYTVPPRWLLDAALEHGLYVLVGLPWEQHVAFLDERERVRSIERRVRDGVRGCAGHPALLGFAVGNEIPASIVRWYGRRRVERFLGRLAAIVREEDPGALVTYVNFPSTEYLHLDFADFVSFNVYLETRAALDRYLARLQNLTGERPLVMAEIGLDSRRNGAEAQAEVLAWQVDAVFRAGCAGAFVFAWTDEWHRGGHDIEDWDFGLVTRDRVPKPALAAVSRAFAAVLLPVTGDLPSVSVIVCSYNGSRTLHDTLEGLARVRYPDVEVIVVDDGSTDGTAAVASEYDVQLIRTENQGLSAARNIGMRAARGEILAYIDDDAQPDPDWLLYLADTYRRTDHVAVGGPNIAPAGDGPIADAVANAPGGPVHVLVSDIEADHIPGCNFSIRRAALEAIGGWDERFRAAGDDVDLCWRLQERSWTIGFNHAAMVWHHRRNSVRAYWKQQQGYGRAEALLEAKWPARYNAAGHVAWRGRIYGTGLTLPVRAPVGRVYHGTWGTALFQSVYEPAPGLLASLPLMPEWWLVVAALAGLAVLGVWWSPLLLALPLLLVAVLLPVAQAAASARRARFPSAPDEGWNKLTLRALTAWLHLIQPLARLRGRIRHGLTPWRRRGQTGWTVPVRRETTVWSETWFAPEQWLGAAEDRLQEAGAVTSRGGDLDRWDLEVRGGLLGSSRLLMAIEEHGAGRQLCRFRVAPRASKAVTVLTTIVATLAILAGVSNAWIPMAALILVASALAMWVVWETGRAARSLIMASQVPIR
ncbi:MAG: glycosyltransferase [Chloroflexota bacterium]|nr:glycosyltransferase [Chloroflexota bacterium]